MPEEIVSYGVLSLIPAILAVVLAFWTKNVIISLMASLFVGCLITAGWNPWNAMQVMFSDHLFVDMTGSSNAQTIIMMSFVGGFVALIEATGGAKAFAAAIANKVHRRSTAQTTAWLGGLAIFFSDSGNSLILGPIFRPIFDRLRISRAKLAYILDSTSSPVCILVPITGWGVYIMGIIATEFENLGIQTSDASAFVQAIPYQFYALLALGINMAYGFGVSEAITIAAVLSGSLFGDHCAPISDTTVMSSMAGGCNHIDHVRTQIPYALLAAVASFIAYLIVGVTQMAAGIALPVALAILVLLFLLATKLFGKKIV